MVIINTESIWLANFHDKHDKFKFHFLAIAQCASSSW